MEKTVVELFAGVGGFRVGLNNVTGFDENGKAVENGIGNLYGSINGNHQQNPSLHLTVIKPDSKKEDCLDINEFK